MLWRRYDSSDDNLVVEFTHVRVGLEELLLRLQIMSLKNVEITARRGRRRRLSCYSHSSHFFVTLAF